LWITLCISVVLHASKAVVEAFQSTWSKNSHAINIFKINNLAVKQKRNVGALAQSRASGAGLLTLCTSCGMGRPQRREERVEAAVGGICRPGSVGYPPRR